MKLEKSKRTPDCLTLYIFPSGARYIAGFLIGLGLVIGVGVIQQKLVIVDLMRMPPLDILLVIFFNLISLFPALIFIIVGLLLLRQTGGTTLVKFDKEKEQVSIHNQKLLGGKCKSWDVPLTDVEEVAVEEQTSIDLEERLGKDERVTRYSYHLVVKIKEGYSLPLSPGGCSHRKAKQTQLAIAQEINQFLELL